MISRRSRSALRLLLIQDEGVLVVDEACDLDELSELDCKGHQTWYCWIGSCLIWVVRRAGTGASRVAECGSS